MTNFDELNRLLSTRLLGFPDLLDKVPNFPLYNIANVKGDDRNWTEVSLAVAGFTTDELSVTLDGSRLIVEGKREKAKTEGQETPHREYIHRGIATRDFTREFTLAEYCEVTSVTHRDGILTIQIEKRIPEEKLPRKLDIG